MYMYNLFLVEPDHLPEEEYPIPGTGLIVSHENGNLFKLEPRNDFPGKDISSKCAVINLRLSYYAFAAQNELAQKYPECLQLALLQFYFPSNFVFAVELLIAYQ